MSSIETARDRRPLPLERHEHGVIIELTEGLRRAE